MKRLLPGLILAASLAAAIAAAAPLSSAGVSSDCSRTSVGFTALPDLGAGTYHGYQGGLYPGGLNSPSDEYLQQGLAARDQVHPINGKIVLLSIGMSNTTQEYSRFKYYADREPLKNSAVVVVDGAQGGQDAEQIRNPSSPYWTFVDQRLAAAQSTAEQVQAVWLKEAIAGENRAFPADALRLQDDLRAIIDILRTRFANLQLVYLSSRTYAGYASSTLNPEPYAYESGFAVKWTIQERIDGQPTRPWLGWGPYLWTDGLRGRNGGPVWQCSDTQADGTHPSDSGAMKVATLLFDFVESDETSAPWFLQSEQQPRVSVYPPVP